jgi:hypothetical protein
MSTLVAGQTTRRTRYRQVEALLREIDDRRRELQEVRQLLREVIAL